MLSFAYKWFDGQVPEPGELDAEDRALLDNVEAGFGTVGELYNACKFRAALGEALAREANGDTFAALSADLDRKAPWFQIKEDPQAAATTVYVILRVVDNLKTILALILPHTAQKLHEYLDYEGQLFGTQHVVEYREETRDHEALTYDHTGAIGTWAPSDLPPGQALRKPGPLFRKLDESLVDGVRATGRVRGEQGIRTARSRGMCPGSFMSNAMRGYAFLGSSPLRRCSANRSRVTALTRCAPIMPPGRWRQRALRRCASGVCSGTTRAARMAGLSPIPPEGEAKCPRVELTMPRRRFSSCCGGERTESGPKGRFSLSPCYSLPNPLSGENQCPVSIPTSSDS